MVKFGEYVVSSSLSMVDLFHYECRVNRLPLNEQIEQSTYFSWTVTTNLQTATDLSHKSIQTSYGQQVYLVYFTSFTVRIREHSVFCH